MRTRNRRFHVGRAQITSVFEMDVSPYPCDQMLIGYDAARHQEKAHLLPPGYPMEPTCKMQIQNWLIEVDGRKIMIDTGVGNDRTFPGVGPEFSNLQTPFLENLRAAGAEPEDIEMVICTHLHIDHVGRNTRWDGEKWVPTFPNARYLFTQTERDYWDPSQPSFNPRALDMALNVFEQGVQPILDAGLADMIEPEARIDDLFSLIPTPGHTPGQIAVRLECDGEGAIFCADALHHPIQILFPDWSVSFEEDPIMSVQSRRRLLALVADENLILIPAHFTHQACRVERRGDEFVPFNIDVTEH